MRWEEYVKLVEAGGAPYVGYPTQAPPVSTGITGFPGAGTTTPITTLPTAPVGSGWFSGLSTNVEQALQEFYAKTPEEQHQLYVEQGLTPEQIAAQEAYVAALTPHVPFTTPAAAAPTTTPVTAEPATAYPGYGTAPYFQAGEMLTAPMSEYETTALQMLSDLAGQLGGMVSPLETPMGEQVGATLTDLLSGKFPEAPMSGQIEALLTSLLTGEFPEEYFRTSIEAPAQKRLEEVTLPSVREAFVGPGTFWGGERAEAERKAGTDLDTTLAAIRGDLGHRARQQALATLGPALEYMGMPAEQAISALGPGMEFMGMPADQMLKQIAGTSTFMGAGALPRLIEQHGLDIAYQEFIRTRPENQPYAQMLLSLLGIPMLGSYAPESPESPLAPLANIAGTLLPLLFAG